MSDLINRQAAIEAIVKLPNAGIHWVVSAEAAINALETLPSAQPEEPETRSISFEDCSIALVSMLIDDVMTDLEYHRIMDKLIAHENAERRKI